MEHFHENNPDLRIFAVSTRGTTNYTDVAFADEDAFLLGPETRGLPQELLDSLPPEKVLRIPMKQGSRSLNLSNAAAVLLYQALHQTGFTGLN